MKYRFEVVRAGSAQEAHDRDLPDDNVAVAWMEKEMLLPGDRLYAYRAGETKPFAWREFAGLVQTVTQ